MKLLGHVFSALIALMWSAAPAIAQERVTAPAGGLSIEKPKGWMVTPPDASIANTRGLQYDSPEFRSLIERVNAPFITMVKYPIDRAGINPTIKVNYLLLPATLRDDSSVELLTKIIDTLRMGFGDIRFLQPPAPMKVAGTQGAHARIVFMVKGSAGTPYQTISEVWIVRRGDYLITLGVSYSPDEPAATVEEIEAAVQSFRIDG